MIEKNEKLEGKLEEFRELNQCDTGDNESPVSFVEQVVKPDYGAKVKEQEEVIENLRKEIEVLRNSNLNAENNSLNQLQEENNDLKERITNLETDKDKIAQEKQTLEVNKENLTVEISNLNEKIATLESQLEEALKVSSESSSTFSGDLTEEVETLKELIEEKEQALLEQETVIRQKNEELKSKIAEIDELKSFGGDMSEYNKIIEEKDEIIADLEETKLDLEACIADYSKQILEAKNKKSEDTSSNAPSVSLEELFPIISDNTVLNARKVVYIRELGENPWLETIVCYLGACLKDSLKGTGLEPFFVILDNLENDVRRLRYKEFGFTLNALPPFNPVPESNVTVTSYQNFPDLKAHLDISNREFIIFIDRYGKGRKYVKRKNITEFNLIHDSEMIKLCKLKIDDNIIATFKSDKIVNSLDLPADMALRGKRDRASCLLGKRAYTDVIEKLKENLFK